MDNYDELLLPEYKPGKALLILHENLHHPTRFQDTFIGYSVQP